MKFTPACFRVLLSISLVAAITGPADTCAEDWPQFRGPRADGTSRETGIPVEWSTTKNLKWKRGLPGKGFSSPIVVGERVYLTAYSGAGNSVTRSLLAFDRNSGEILWKQEVSGVSDGGEPGFAYHGQASHTPVCDGQRIYVMFGSSGVHAYDLDGKEQWKVDVGNERRARFGTSSSPVLYKDTLIITAGSESESIRALDCATGKEVWKQDAASLSRTYSTPVIAENSKGEDVLLLSVTNEVWGFNPVSGKFNWFAETRVDTAACPTIVVHDQTAYVIGGRSGGRAAIALDGTGEKVQWSENGGSYVPSPVYHKGKLYYVNDRGIATCIDAKSGEEIGRKRIGGQFYASIVLIEDRLYAVSRFDGTHVLSATPDFDEIAHNQLGDDSDTSGSPAVSNGQLFLRSDQALYCIQAE